MPLRAMGVWGRILVWVCSSSRGCRSCAAGRWGVYVCVRALAGGGGVFIGGPCLFLVGFRWGRGGEKEEGHRHSLMRVNAGSVSVWGQGGRERDSLPHDGGFDHLCMCAFGARVCFDGEGERTKLTFGKGGEIDLLRGAGRPRAAAAAVGSSLVIS